MRLAAVLVAVVSAGCLKPGLVECPNDLLCPAGEVCDLVHGGCVTPAQTEACVGLANDEACTAGSVIGYCLDEICIDPGCGNFIVDRGELCDDGNRIDGDGCSETCVSREVCGDGFVNVDLGEECDDGSLQSHDGCDSRCLVETAVWSYDEIGPSNGVQSWTAFDATRGKTVMVMDGYVWGWTGTRWMVLASGAPKINSDYDVVFDPTRGTLLAIFARPNQADILIPDPERHILYEWDGTTWTAAETTNAPEVQQAVLTYDTVRRRVFLFGLSGFGSIVTAQLDVATRQWTTVIAPSAPVGINEGFAIAFDENRGRVVVVTAGTTAPLRNPTVLEWAGSGWVASQPTMASLSGWSLIYDRTALRVLALGGAKTSTTSAAQSWNGTTWTSLPDLPGMRGHPSATFDTVRQLRVVFGGYAPTEDENVVEGTQTAWTVVPRVAPPELPTRACAFDEPRRRLVCVGAGSTTFSETWEWSAATSWKRIPTTWPSDPPTSVTFDPVRGIVVGVGVVGLVGFVDDDWVELTNMNPLFERSNSTTFDPVRKELVTLLASEFGMTISVVRIAQDNSVTQFPSEYFESLAYDARNQVVVGLAPNKTAQLVDDLWVPIVGPGNGHVAATNARRGTVEFVAPGKHTVERIGSQWTDRPELPPIAVTGSTVFDQTTGELFVLGALGSSRFMLHRRWESATPFETCSTSDDDDVDGDGLAGCADPDCWTACTPVCSPFVACP